MLLKQIQINDHGIIDDKNGDWFTPDPDLIDLITASENREYIEGWGGAIERVTIKDSRYQDEQHFFISE